MIKIISKDEYNTLQSRSISLSDKVRTLNFNIDNLHEILEETKVELNKKIELLEKAITENEVLKTEKKTLKSKITRLENQIKKLQNEQNKDKKLVKETLKEVHKARAKRVAKKNKEEGK